MYTRHLPMQLARALAPARFATAALVTLTLVSAACSDPTAPRSAAERVASVSSPASAFELSSLASDFPVLANAAITCTDGNITGDVGTFFAEPTGSMTRTTCPLNGTVHLGDDASKQAYANFLDTYAALAPKSDDVCTYLTGTLAGVTLSPGAYCFNGAATVTGILTLDGPSDGVWSFQIGSGGTGALTGTGFSVAMAGGGHSCNVTWRVADATTMTTSGLQGHLMAGAAITLTGGTFRGSAWSKADVTITGTQVTSCS